MLHHPCINQLYAAAAKLFQSCPTLLDPIDGSPPGFTITGTLQARTLEWVAISFSNAWKWKEKVKSLSHIQLSDPMGCSIPGSSVHGIFQARVLEWGAIAFSESMLDNIKHFWEVFFFNPCKKLTHKNEDVLSQSLFLLTYCSHSFSNANHIQLKISVDFTYKLSHYLGPFLRRNRLS